MTTVEVGQLERHIGQTVRLRGMIYKIREMSGFAFVILRAKKAFLQCVYIPEQAGFSLSDLREEMSVEVVGQVIRDERSRAGLEVRLLDCACLSVPAQEPPLAINGRELELSLDNLLGYRPITLRNERERAIFSIQAALCRGLRAFLEEEDFTEIHSPKIVSGGAEGGSNIFHLDYFGKEACLAQSPQLYKQIMVGVFERVYEIAPVFRAEKHHTSRHLSEYTSVDLEMGFIQSFRDVMALEARMLASAFAFAREHCDRELALWKADVPDVVEIPSMTFHEAKEAIAETYHRPIADWEDFEPEEEKLLCELVKRRTDSDFVFVTHYKSSKRPFYAMDSLENPELTDSFDLLFRGVEITTGGQRIHDYDSQVAKMRGRGIDPGAFGGYLMAHRCGLPPHGGLGLGLERLTARLLGIENLRRATLFPRDVDRLEP